MIIRCVPVRLHALGRVRLSPVVQRVLQRYSSSKDDASTEKREEKKLSMRKEDIMTIPNMLTTSRLVLTPIIGHAVLHHEYNTALGLFCIAGITDMVLYSEHSMAHSLV